MKTKIQNFKTGLKTFGSMIAISSVLSVMMVSTAHAQSNSAQEQETKNSWLQLLETVRSNTMAEYLYQEFLDYSASEMTDTKNPYRPPYKYRKIHNEAPVIIDMHADSLVVTAEEDHLDRMMVNKNNAGQVDIPRLIEANVSLQVFAAYSKGSLDIMGQSASFLTGHYIDEDGNEHSRYEYVRDPDILEYDDPADRYADHYGEWGFPRDLGTYGFRVSRASRDNPNGFCETWYDTGVWSDYDGLRDPGDCPGFELDRMYLERILDVGRRFDELAAADNRLIKVTNAQELDALMAARANNKNLVGGLLATEGLYFRSDESTPEGAQKLRDYFTEMYDAGFRMFALTHFIDNDHGGAATGMARATLGEDGLGASEEGKLIADMVFASNSIMDVAHASPATLDALVTKALAAERPVVFSHGGLQNAPQLGDNTQCASARNLPDADVLKIASTGGVVGIGFAQAFLCGVSPISWASSVRYAVDLIDDANMNLHNNPALATLEGVNHIGLGSDYDGGIVAYTDIANLNQYTEALVCEKSYWTPNCLENPFTKTEAYKILGQNVYRVLHENLSAQ